MRLDGIAACIAAIACSAGMAIAQPVWSIDLNTAKQGTFVLADAQAAAGGVPTCAARTITPLSVLADTFIPGFVWDGETFDYGASAVAAPRAVGLGVTDASTTAVFGVRGLGTAQVVLYCRAATQHSASANSCGYQAQGHGEVATNIPLLIVGGGSGGAAVTAYQVNYQFEYTGSAATPYETVPPLWPEDGIICSGGAELGCPIESPASAFSAGFITGYAPERTGAPIIGTGSVIVAPGWSGGGVVPGREPVLFAGIGAVIDDVMTSPLPAGGGTPDTCAGDFTVRLTLTIGAAVPTGACCRANDCIATTPQACASFFNGRYLGDGGACIDPINHQHACCPGNFNGSGGVGVQDIFDFLAAYFGNATAADFNGSGTVSVQDIFDFLAAYFRGCA